MDLLDLANEELSADALVSPDRLRSHLDRGSQAETDFDVWSVFLCNAASAYLTNRCGRVLRSTNFREAVTASVTTTADSVSLSGSGLDAVALANDDIFAAGLRAGSRVVSVAAGGATLTLDRPAKAAATVTATFGRGARLLNGRGALDIRLGESPVTEVWSAAYEWPAGTWVDMDLTNSKVTDSGRLFLPNTGLPFPQGIQNVRVEMQCGYRRPTPTVQGHSEWFTLERLALRVAEVLWSDHISRRGRSIDISYGQISSRIFDFAMPADVENDARQFERFTQ